MPINSYSKTGVSPKWPLEIFDPAPYLKRETDTVPDERRGQALTINAILLELQAIQKVLGTLPNWQEGQTYTDLLLGSMPYGDGSDGDVIISGSPTTLTEDKYYQNLTIAAGGTLNTGGYRVFVRGTLLISSGATIHRNGLAGASGGTALDAEVLGGSGAGGAANGGAGGSSSQSLGGSGGDGGGGGSGGTATAPSPSPGLKDLSVATKLSWLDEQFQGGGGGGGGSSVDGGRGGSGGGVVMIAAKQIINSGTISANGGDGETGDPAQTAGGGGGGGGGFVMLLTSQSLSGNLPEVSGGAPGPGTNGGSDGDPGTPGNFTVVVL